MDPMYMDSMPLHMDHPLHGMGGGIGGVCDPHMNGLSLQEMIDTGILTGVLDAIIKCTSRIEIKRWFRSFFDLLLY